MIKRLRYGIILIMSAVCTPGIQAQVLSDSTAVRMIKEGIGYVYNMEFDKAETIVSEIQVQYPNHPVVLLMKAIITSWKNYPLVSSSSARQPFEEYLRTCIDLSSRKPYSEEFRAESLLANICARGLLLMYYSENDLSMKVIPLAAGTYKYVMRSFDYVTSFGDFYYFTGLYKYYREAYPMIHPVYKPVASLFPHGNIEEGLKELDKCGETAVFLKPEAWSMLTWIFFGFENDLPAALAYSSRLVSVYPANPLFREYHIRNLLLLHKYDEAEIFINEAAGETSNVYILGTMKIFSGIVQEKKYKNYDHAKKLYREGINAISPFGYYGNEYSGYAYLGLSRICDHNGDKSCKRDYRKKGLELVTFRNMTFD
jgi:tetratricopeptide (TPR) repeat protein